jgi:lysine-N-methylase
MNYERPRLAVHVLPRRHLIDGEEVVVLHNAKNGELLKLPAELYAIVAYADGTRDLDGIALAASRDGHFTRMSVITSLMETLNSYGALADGIEPAEPAVTTPRLLTTDALSFPDLPLERLEGHRFCCTGAGSCCAQYATIGVTADDLIRARRAGLQTLPGDHREERVVLPLYGGAFRQAMTLVNGRCLQLTADSQCGLHHRGGPSAKPVACAAFPAVLVEDGEKVRLSAALECDCVFHSRDESEGASLLPMSSSLHQLPAGLTVRRLPRDLELTASQTVPTATYAQWSKDLPPTTNAPWACATLAAGLAERGLRDLGTSERDESLRLPALSALRSALRVYSASMDQAAESSNAWRSPKDRTRLLRNTIAQAARSLQDPNKFQTLLSREQSSDEAFTLRMSLFGYHLVGERPFAETLVELAVVFLVARELLESNAPVGHPIAAVLACGRGAQPKGNSDAQF